MKYLVEISRVEYHNLQFSIDVDNEELAREFYMEGELIEDEITNVEESVISITEI